MNEQELRELDAWIAEHVMGWKLQGHHRPRYWEQNDPDKIWFLCEVGSEDSDVEWSPTQSGSQSMQVLEKCAESGVLSGEFMLPVSIRRRGDLQWVVSENAEDEEPDSPSHYIVVEASTLPTAICLFAKQLFSK